jgi:hypothetical protein
MQSGRGQPDDNCLAPEVASLIYVANGRGIFILSHQQVLRGCASTEAGLRAGRFVSRERTGVLMETVLILYAICASALLIWSTSRRNDDLSQKCTHPASKIGIDYIAVPSSLLSKWIACYPNLVVFSIFNDSERKAGKEDCPGMLTISMHDLPGLLKWFPPGSQGAFVRGDAVERFDSETEARLLQLGIDAIYLLDDGVNCAPSVTLEKRPEPDIGDRRKKANAPDYSLRGTRDN